MNQIQILLLSGCLIVFVLDALTSIASRRFNFNYGWLAPLSFVIYAGMGFFGAKAADQSVGIILAASIGFFDATIGWKISMALKANTGNFDNNPSISKWISTAIFVTCLAAIFGLLGTVLVRVIS